MCVSVQVFCCQTNDVLCCDLRLYRFALLEIMDLLGIICPPHADVFVTYAYIVASLLGNMAPLVPCMLFHYRL